MIQEDKNLILKDLCARLPYGVKVKGYSGKTDTLTLGNCDLVSMFYKDEDNWYCKPYLRQMDSMTDEELEAYHNLCFEEEREVCEYGEWITKVYYHDTIYSIDWLNKNMFDFRGLIPKDLALSTDEYNPYKN